jgi:hypothetical protein
MGIFGGRKNPEAMIEKANRLKELVFEAASPGTLYDYPVAVNGDASSWEIHYILHVSAEVFSQITMSPQIIVGVAAAEINAQGVPLLCILVRLNNKQEYSYAMVARVTLLGDKGSVLESLNYGEILLQQRTFTLTVMSNGRRLSATINNPLHNSPYMMKMKEHLDSFLKVKGNIFGYSAAERNLWSSVLMETRFSSMSEAEIFGQLIWSKHQVKL